MLIYASSKAFPRKTFVVSAKNNHTVARVRAQLMHILYELGREDHQFRLRFNGEFLKDSLTLDDYSIVDNAVLKMIPMAKEHDSLLDLRSLVSEITESSSGGAVTDVKTALLDEVTTLESRQTLTNLYHGLLSMHFIGTVCSLVSSYWYSFLYLLPAYMVSSYFAPHFSRLSGFTGNYSIIPQQYCWIFSVLMLAITGSSTTLSVLKWKSILAHGCPGWEFVDDCSHHNVYTAIFFGIHAIVFLITAVLLIVMVFNYKFKQGDYVEKLLVQTRDLNKILLSAASGKLKERRMAAFELASMAATSDDNKFMIVAESGLVTLVSLSLTDDLATQEYAAEALAELLTIPEIQNKFVETDGVRHLTALLHSKSHRCVQEAVTGLSYIVQDNERNKYSLIANRGLNDLCSAVYCNNVSTQRALSGIFLELIFTKEIRDEIASMNTPAQALIHLCGVDDDETRGFALQSLELLAIESPDTIYAQSELIGVLMKLPCDTVDMKIHTLTAKLLLYFAENYETCEKLLQDPTLSETLSLLVKNKNSTIQKVVVKIIYSMSEHPELRILALNSNLDLVLNDIKNNNADRDVWNMADTGIQMIQSADSLAHLPLLTTEDKVSRMNSHTGSPPVSLRASLTSLRSINRRAGGLGSDGRRGSIISQQSLM